MPWTPGRFRLAGLLAAVVLIAVSATVVYAGKGDRQARVSRAEALEQGTCRGSPAGARRLARLCDARAVAGPGTAGQGSPAPAPAAESAPAAFEPSGPHPGPATALVTLPAPADSPQPAPALDPQPEPPAAPEPQPEPPPEPEPDPEPAPDPEPEPQPPPEPEPSEPESPAPEPEPSAPPGQQVDAIDSPTSPSSRSAPAPRGPLYWGAWIGSHLRGSEAPWDMGAVQEFEAMAGKDVSLIHFSSPFAACSYSGCDYYEFPAGPMNNIRATGAIPFFSWGSQSTPATRNQPDFQLSDLIEGRHDAYIRRFAAEARNWGHPFFLRFNWEMNGNWFAWMEGVNGNRPGEAVAAWRHVHDIFEEVGATNATWVWCPNVDPDRALRDLDSLYPGDAYVDWTGLDGYNWGTHPAGNDRWRSFDELYRRTYEEITRSIAPNKPLVISEVGSSEQGGSKAAWIRDALAAIAGGYPHVRGLIWFEKYDDGMDWPIATSQSATEAFAAGIASPLFLDDAFGSLSAAPIHPAG